MTCLIVDDDRNCRFALSRLVQKWGWAIFEADCAESAFSIVEKRTVDVIFMDENMGMDKIRGQDAIRKLRDLGYRGVIAGCSGNVSRIVRRKYGPGQVFSALKLGQVGLCIDYGKHSKERSTFSSREDEQSFLVHFVFSEMWFN